MEERVVRSKAMYESCMTMTQPGVYALVIILAQCHRHHMAQISSCNN